MAEEKQTMSKVIETIIDDKINQILRPIKVQITKKYNDGHVDIKTANDETLTYVAYIGNATVNKTAILLFLEDDEQMVIA